MHLSGSKGFLGLFGWCCQPVAARLDRNKHQQIILCAPYASDMLSVGHSDLESLQMDTQASQQ